MNEAPHPLAGASSSPAARWRRWTCSPPGTSAPRAAVPPYSSPFVEFATALRFHLCWQPNQRSCSFALKIGSAECSWARPDCSAAPSSSPAWPRWCPTRASYLYRCRQSSGAIAEAWPRQTSWSAAFAPSHWPRPDCFTSCCDAGTTAASHGAISGSFASMILRNAANTSLLYFAICLRRFLESILLYLLFNIKSRNHHNIEDAVSYQYCPINFEKTVVPSW